MVYERSLKDVENIVLDLDGTVWEWNRLKEGVKSTIETLESNGKTVTYLTNNAVLRRSQYAEKLREMGLKADTSDVLCGSTIAAKALQAEGVSSVFAIGEEGLRAELREHNISHSEEADHVLVAVDRNLSYWKIAQAVDRLRTGAQLWVTGEDPYWWAGDRQMPGTASIANAVRTAAALDDGAGTVTGKPSEYAMQAVRDAWGFRPPNTIIVGDSIHTDVVFGNHMGFMTGVVLGGNTDRDDLEDLDDFEMPDIVFRSFKRIVMKI